MIDLRQSTASQEIPLGYFVDASDGNTEETALTIANTDIKIWKSGATTLANKNSGGATHMSNGIYYTVFDATDTDTLGPLVVYVHVAGALTVRQVCNVLSAAQYDFKYGIVAPAVPGSAMLITAGTGSGQLDVTSGIIKSNLSQILGTALTETSGQIAGAFKKWFDVATPTGTVNTIPTVTNLTNAPTSGDFTATMKDSLNAATPAVTVSDKTGFSLSSAGVQAIWDALASAMLTAGSLGKLIVDFLDAAVSSRLSTLGTTAPAGWVDAAAVAAGALNGKGDWNIGKTGYSLTAAYDAAKTASQAGDAMAVTGDFTALMKASLNAATPASVVGSVGSVLDRVTANTDLIGGQIVTAFTGITFPEEVASPTNITSASGITLAATTHTGAVIPTVTNLTNAPTSGDFTATMKASLNAATPASVVGSVGSVTAAVTVTGDLSATMKTSVAAAVAAIDIDGYTLQNANKLMFAAMTGTTSGSGTTTNVYYAPDGITARISGTIDASRNRTAVVLTP